MWTQPTVERETSWFVDPVVDTDRTRIAFRQSALVRRLWPPEEIVKTDPYFELQGRLNVLMAQGANPLMHIEDLHAVLTGTDLPRCRS